MEHQKISDRILKLKEVCAQTSLSRSTIYLRMANGNFPLAINLGNRSVGWLESEIQAWITLRVVTSRAAGVCQ